MGFGGQILSDAWNDASEAARRGATAIADGAHWIGEKTATAANYLREKTDQAVEWTEQQAHRMWDATKDAAQKAWTTTKQTASELYKKGVEKAKQVASKTKATVHKVKCALEEKYKDWKKPKLRKSKFVGDEIKATYGSMTFYGKEADVDRFFGALENNMGATKSGRARLDAALADTQHPTTYFLGENQPNVLVDSFGSNEVNLADLEKFPSSAPSTSPNMTTRGEVVAHFVTERMYSANHPTEGFGPAHEEGIRAQNEVRGELGQAAATSNVSSFDSAGNPVLRMNYADGTHAIGHLNSQGNLTSLDPP